jgi:hypothetical protein
VGGTGDFTEGLGYSMQRSAAGVVTFSGTALTTGTKVVNIAGTTDRGWNLIGNPYTAPIDAATFLTANATTNLDPSFQFVYLWDQSKNDYTQTTTGNIALGQGFFVNSKDGGGTVSFTTAMQSTAAATFKSDEIPWPSIKLMARGQELYNETSLSFNSGMSLGLDPGFDGGKLRGNPDIALYTKLVEDNGVDFAVQALPAITQEVFSIPVGLDFEPGGEITFSLETN